jgi:endonuclease/exonuclease/phosphatase family metal-dependent hydrolase
MDTDGHPGCLDYIWVLGPVAVAGARVAWDRPAAHDRTLYPSDHFGLVADLEVG